MKIGLLHLICGVKGEILKIKWSQRVRNLNIRKKTNQPQLSNIIKKRRLQWFGHLQRMDASRLPPKLYRWTPYHGQRKPGRPPRISWKDIIRRDLDSLMTGWSLEEAEVAARDQKIWGHFLRQAAGAEMHDAI